MSTHTRTVLYATYVSPFPTNSGERIRALNLIACLRHIGYRVEAVVGNYNNIDLAAHSMDGVRFHEIPFAWPRLRQAMGVYFWPHREFIQQVKTLHESGRLRAVLIDYGFMGAQIPALGTLGVPIILGTHNFESALTRQAPKSSISTALGLRLRQAVETWHERTFFRDADAVICVSEEDRDIYSQFISQDRLHVVPNFSDVPDRYADAARLDRIIMSGSFDNFQNLDGLRWFVREVWDGELQERTELCVAGKHSDRAVLEFAQIPGVLGLGAREDLLSEIARARCAIVPVRHGSGTRFKCLEAMAVRTPVVTTAKGCEGIDHEGTFHVCNSAQSFKKAILKVLDDADAAAQMAAKARAVFDRRYNLAANAARLENVLTCADTIRTWRCRESVISLNLGSP